MKKFLITCICFSAFSLLFAATLQAKQEQRLALLIGNSNYTHGGSLDNPVNDVRAIKKALEGLGFTVMKYEDCSQKTMKRAMDKFGRKLQGKNVGLFFYAGHGVQVNGHNYLMPVNAKLDTEHDAEYDCVRADRVLAKMEGAGSKTNIVILDACRDNPFERSWRRGTEGTGLAFMNAPSGSLIAYSTAPGKTALDGRGKNSPYTSALLQHIGTPNITVIEMFQGVRSTVMNSSGSKQIPWESTSLRGNFYFTKQGTDNRFSQEQARLERERREFEQAKAKFERRRKESQNQKIEVASVPKKQSYSRPSSTSNVVESPFPKPKGLVNDFANVIPPAYEQKIAAVTGALLQQTGIPVVVVTMPDIGGAEYNDYANRLYKAWGIGKKGEDKGVLIFVTMKERKMRIETGYGVVGILPDGLVGEIRDRYMTPHLKQNKFGEGLLAGASAVAQVIAKASGIELTASNLIDSDSTYIVYANGIVKDTNTGLEWKVGPDRDTDWNEARSWVQSLNLDGGGWRMPSMDELEGLYMKGKGERNMTSLLKTTGWYVWSGETKGSSFARFFYFDLGSRYWPDRDFSDSTRAFAVRSRNDG